MMFLPELIWWTDHLKLLLRKWRSKNPLQSLHIIQSLNQHKPLGKPNRRYINLLNFILTTKQVLPPMLNWKHHYLRSSDLSGWHEVVYEGFWSLWWLVLSHGYWPRYRSQESFSWDNIWIRSSDVTTLLEDTWLNIISLFSIGWGQHS